MKENPIITRAKEECQERFYHRADFCQFLEDKMKELEKALREEHRKYLVSIYEKIEK